MKTIVALAVSSAFFIAAIVSAPAQTASIGHTAVVSGAGVKGAHADQVSVNVEDGNLNVSGGIADGVRVGDTKIQIGAGGAASLPVPTPSRPVPVPTPEQAAAPIVAPVNAAKQVAKKVFGF